MDLASGKVIINDTTGAFHDQNGAESLDTNLRTIKKANGDTVLDWSTGEIGISVETIQSYISPPLLAAATHDWSPTGLSAARIVRMGTTGGNYDLTGINATDGRILTLMNVAGGVIKLKNENSLSLAANRFILNGDISIKVNQATTIWYDPVSTRWRAVNNNVL